MRKHAIDCDQGQTLGTSNLQEGANGFVIGKSHMVVCKVVTGDICTLVMPRGIPARVQR